MTEFDEQLKQRLLAFQTHHGLAGSGRVEAGTWSRLVAGASGDSQVAQAAIGQVAAAKSRFAPDAEALTSEQILDAWHKSTDLNDFKLRILLGPVTDDALFEFLRRKKVVLPERDTNNDTYTGPAAKPLPKSEKIVGRIIYSPSPDGVGMTKKYVQGTEAELEQLQRNENDRATMMGLQGIASSGRGKGSANPSVQHTAAPRGGLPRSPAPAGKPNGAPPTKSPQVNAPKTPAPAGTPQPKAPATPPAQGPPPPSGPPGGMTPAALAAEVKAAWDYYPGHTGQTGSLLVPGREPMRIKSGFEGGPWGGTHRGGIPRGRGEAYTSRAPHRGNIATHVEGHTAAIMHQQGINEATLVMGAEQCEICANNLPTALPPGSRLTVISVINGNIDTNVYRSNQIP